MNKESLKHGNNTPWWKSLYTIRYKDGWREPYEITLKQSNFIAKSLELEKDLKILDLACGYGRHAIELAKMGYTNIEGLDYSEELIRAAKCAARKEKLQVQFIQGNMLTMKFKEKYDIIYLMDVSFGLFTNEKNILVLKKIANALKPKGKLLLELFNIYSIHKFQKKIWYSLHGVVFLIENTFDVLKSELICKCITFKKNRFYKYPTQKIRVYSYQEIDVMLRNVGIGIVQCYGDSCNLDLKNNRFDIYSPFMVIIGQKK